MADALIFEFGADVTKFNASIGEVTAEIKKLKEVLKSATGSEIPKLNAEISALQTSLKNLKNVGTPAAAAFTKVEDSAKGARIALTNVSQIAQDLPFGFIGIQNNIPGLVQSFTKLSGESGGVVAALKAMGSALIGPAGIFLAFSVVTSAATVLISKYGSLGAAFDAFFGKTDKLTKQILDTAKAYDEYNKSLKTNGQLVAQATGSVDAQITKAKFLQKEIENLQYSDEYRKVALQELIKLDKTRFENFDIEKGKLDGLATAVDNYSESLLRNAVAKIYENKLAESAVSLNTQRDLLAEIAKGYDEVAARRKAQALEGPIFDPATGAEIAKPFIGTKSLDKQFEAQKKIVDESIKQYDKLKQSYIEAFEAALQFTQLDTPKPGKEPKAPKVKIPKGRAGLFDYLVTEVDKALIPISRLQGKLDDLLKPRLSPFRFEDPNLKNPLQNQIDALKIFVQKSEEAKNQFKDFFFDPVNALFTNFFETGKFTIQAFGDVLLAQVKKIVAELITSKILSLLASLIPGVGAGSAALKAGSAIGKFIGAGGNLLGRGAANFGGVQGGGLGMSGSVNLTLRGTDLVGAINRTNSQISRVG